jgi:hypothetical protein
MKRIFWVYFALMACGLAVLAWPEENSEMMIRISETHGPSKPDIVGIIIIMLGYIPVVAGVLKASGKLRQQIGNGLWSGLLTFTLLSFFLIAYSLYSEKEMLLWTSVFTAAALQGILAFHSFRKENSHSR